MSRRREKNYLLTVVMALSFVLTVFCLALGCLMYTSNAKAVRKNLVYVQMTGLLSNIDYGLHFGKSIDTYYGMQKLLDAAVQSAENVDEVYIVNENDEILFQTGTKTPGEKVTALEEGDHLKEGRFFYCSFSVIEHVRLITEGDISETVKEWNAYYIFLIKIAAAGFLAASVLMILIRKGIQRQKATYRLTMAVLVLWVLTFSSLIGFCTYREYMESIDNMCEDIDRTVAADFEHVYSQGIEDENINGIDEYLTRYVSNIPELASAEIRDNKKQCRYELSVSYLNKRTLDYILQTLLLLAFSVMLLTEYQLFITGIGIREWEEDRHEGA
uniref:hypothetical protein n=1 Tax=Eubacterium cellulosolvens TaxID=29322 RepID=UPI0004850051|nr:hypothetical protein [[Eubacterium] cellulosolvens]